MICRKVMFVIFLSSSFLTRTYAQDEKVSFEVQNAKLTEIISILEKSTGYTFLYQDELDISIYEREIECGVNEMFGRDKFGMVGRG